MNLFADKMTIKHKITLFLYCFYTGTAKKLHLAPVFRVLDIHLVLLTPHERYISRHLSRLSKMSRHSFFWCRNSVETVQKWCRKGAFLVQKRCKPGIHSARNVGTKDGKPIQVVTLYSVVRKCDITQVRQLRD